jgi:hypothetical protein
MDIKSRLKLGRGASQRPAMFAYLGGALCFMIVLSIGFATVSTDDARGSAQRLQRQRENAQFMRQFAGDMRSDLGGGTEAQRRQAWTTETANAAYETDDEEAPAVEESEGFFAKIGKFMPSFGGGVKPDEADLSGALDLDERRARRYVDRSDEASSGDAAIAASLSDELEEEDELNTEQRAKRDFSSFGAKHGVDIGKFGKLSSGLARSMSIQKELARQRGLKVSDDDLLGNDGLDNGLQKLNDPAYRAKLKEMLKGLNKKP